MERQGKLSMSVLNMAILFLGLVCCVSCATQSITDVPRQRDLLFAEHSTMKKRLPLVERENDVLAKENDHYRRWVRDLENNIKKLSAELAATQEANSRELAAKREEINHLEIAMQKLEEETSERITVLNTAMVAQEEKFIAQREQLIKEMELKESILNSQLASKEKELDAKAVEIATLASAKADLEKALEKKQLEISELATFKTTLENTLASKGRELSRLTAANEKNEKKINDTNEMIASLKKARDKSRAELESAKAANADLVKTFSKLFNQLQLKEDQSGTKI
jgi:chromosome segregation ATPase